MLNINIKYWIIIILIKISPSYSQTNISSGEVSGTWTVANSPYYINGEITIPNESTLIIEPGVRVIFRGQYKFNVQGRLLAIGNEQDSIRFTAEDKNIGWHGLRFSNTPNSNDTSKIIYCSFKYGKAITSNSSIWDRCGGAIFILGFDKVLISNCLIDSNRQSGMYGPAIYIEKASPVIIKSTFSNNSGTNGAITCYYSYTALISNNVFINNQGEYGAIICGWNSTPIISGNIISHNTASTAGGGIFVYIANPLIINNLIFRNKAGEGGGIKCYVDANPTLINNTIVYNNGINGGGIAFDDNCNPILINNILFNNSGSFGNQVCILDAQSAPAFLFCDIQDGKNGFKGIGSGTMYTGKYENNIDVNPSFTNVEVDDYRLNNVSQCIGAGIDSIEIDGAMYHCPSLCKMGNSRPSPAGSNPDLGAFENLLGKFVYVEEEFVTPKEFALYQNYPNPFNPTTKISWQSPVSGRQTLKIFDMLGREIAPLVDEEKPAGTYEATWNAANLPCGVYFYQLKVGSYTSTKKLLLLK